MYRRYQITICAISLLLLRHPAAAQVEFEGVQMRASGDISTGYQGDLDNVGASDHGLTVGGVGSISGFFYNPNFLSFNVQPYYNRSQSNSDSQSIFDSSGYAGNVSIFGGSHFPGVVSFNQVWNGTGTYGIPGITGLTTKDSNRDFSVGWNELVPGLPTLGVSFARGSGTGSVVGSDEESNNTTETFGIHSGYRVAGWNLGGGFTHFVVDTSGSGLLEDGGTQTTDTSTNSYQLNAGHALPWVHGSFNAGLVRTDYNGSYLGETSGSDHGTTDSAYANASFPLWRFPISASVTYTDNLYGSLEEQLLSSGGTQVETSLTPVSRSLLVNVGTSYAILPQVVASGYVTRQEEVLAGTSYGLTQFGGNIHFGMGKRLKGLTVTVGANDTASQVGNQGAALVANVTYNRNFDGWDVGAWFSYDQNVVTQFAMYQTSTINYNAQVRRRLPGGFNWTIGGGGGRSVFVQAEGEGSHGEGASSSLNWRRYTVAATYSESTGTTVYTPTGLVSVPTPVVSNNLVVFSGQSYSFSLGASPTRAMSLGLSYNKANSNMLGQSSVTSGLNSNNGSQAINGLLTYKFRKVYFQAGVTQFRQEISASSSLPAVVTSYYFGLSRWFRAF